MTTGVTSTPSTGTGGARTVDPVLTGKMVTERDLPWASGYGTFPNQVGDDDYIEPPTAADLCPSAPGTALAADGSLHYELDAYDDWVFVDEWVSTSSDAARAFEEAAGALDRCPHEWHDGDTTVSFESRDGPATTGVDEARVYTIRVAPPADDAAQYELLLARSGAVRELLTVERSDLLEQAEYNQLHEVALTKLASPADLGKIRPGIREAIAPSPPVGPNHPRSAG
jgi:hypothetical protein